MNKAFLLFLIIPITFYSCTLQKKSVENSIIIDSKSDLNPPINTNISIIKEKEDLIASYKPSDTLFHDLLHTKLDLSFNYKSNLMLSLAFRLASSTL